MMAQIINNKGKWCDFHNHFSIYILFSKAYNLAGYNLETYQQFFHKNSIVVLYNFHDNFTELETIESEKPCFVFYSSLHQCRINSAGKKLLEGAFPGLLDRVIDKKWCETHMFRLLSEISQLMTFSKADVSRYIDKQKALGLCGEYDMLLVNREILTLCLQNDFNYTVEFYTDFGFFNHLTSSEQEKIHGIKFFIDGTLGQKTAAIHTEKGVEGILLYESDHLKRLLTTVHAKKKHIAFHAIGDSAIEQVLNAIERLQERGIVFETVRLEHAMLINKIEAERCKKLKVILCMQVNFNRDSIDFKDKYPESFLKRINNFRMLIDDVGFQPGRDLIFGTDGMPTGFENCLDIIAKYSLKSQQLSEREFLQGINSDFLKGIDSIFF